MRTTSVGTMRRSSPFLARHRREFDRQASSIVDAEVVISGSERAGIEARNVEQRERISSTASSEASILRASLPRSRLALDQARGEKARGIERLQDVVAGGGEEPRLAEIGLVGLGLRLGQRGIESRQFGGALATRRSSVSLARAQGSAAATRSVMSAKVMTMPPSGMALLPISRMRPAAGPSFSWKGSL